MQSKMHTTPTSKFKMAKKNQQILKVSIIPKTIVAKKKKNSKNKKRRAY